MNNFLKITCFSVGFFFFLFFAFVLQLIYFPTQSQLQEELTQSWADSSPGYSCHTTKSKKNHLLN